MTVGAHRRLDSEKLLKTTLEDWAHDDTEIRKLAKKVLKTFDVDGDAHGVPTVVDIVEFLVNEIVRLRKLTK